MQGHFFDRSDVGLKNIAKFFMDNSEEEREHANKLIKYHNQRGGITVYSNIKVCDFNVKILKFLIICIDHKLNFTIGCHMER